MLPAAPIPAGYYAGAWTGSELFIHTLSYSDIYTRGGSIDVAYSPNTRTWRWLPSSPYPIMPTEGGYRVIWTGSEMLAFGSMYAAYSPATNSWRPLPSGPVGSSVTVWTGTQVLMWGGGCCSSNTNAGSAFDVARNRWEPLPTSPLAPRRAPGVWTGKEMIVIGGMAVGSPGAEFADAAAYNPATHTWRTLPPMPAPLFGQTLTWTGTEVLVVGGAHRNGDYATVTASALAFNPATNTWRRLADMPFTRYHHLAAWTGNQLLVWGGEMTSWTPTEAPVTPPPHGVAYDPATNRWSSMPTSPLKARTDAISVWTGKELIIWGGYGVPSQTSYGDGATFVPSRVALTD